MKGERDTVPEAAAVRADITGEYRRALAESADGVVAELHRRRDLTLRERELAHDLAELVVEHLPGAMRGRPDNLRLAELEGWRRDLDAWRLRLTGVADGNGRLGALDRTVAALAAQLAEAIATLRADVGTAEERAEERKAASTVTGVRRWFYATAAATLLAVGGGGYAVYQADKSATRGAAAAEARTASRLDAHDDAIAWLFNLLGAPRPPEPEPRIP